MIKGRCFTNLDDWKRYEWPEVFVAVPRVGELVQGKGHGQVTMPTLKVVAVTHFVEPVHGPGGRPTGEFEPVIRVELHR